MCMLFIYLLSVVSTINFMNMFTNTKVTNKKIILKNLTMIRNDEDH